MSYFENNGKIISLDDMVLIAKKFDPKFKSFEIEFHDKNGGVFWATFENEKERDETYNKLKYLLVDEILRPQ